MQNCIKDVEEASFSGQFLQMQKNANEQDNKSKMKQKKIQLIILPFALHLNTQN